jgi:hypothetical protein
MNKKTQNESNLFIYNKYGFKFFLCNSDKSPAVDWRKKENLLSLETAEKLQKMGLMIGALIPKNIVVLDIDKNNKSLNFTKTFTVKTKNNGFHVFILKNNLKKIKGNVEKKFHGEYVITAGSCGYSIETYTDIC